MRELRVVRMATRSDVGSFWRQWRACSELEGERLCRKLIDVRITDFLVLVLVCGSGRLTEDGDEAGEGEVVC